MGQKLVTDECSAAWRSFHFRPPDPVWAPSAAIERARRLLADFDPRLAIWWSPYRRAAWDPETPGRWRIVEWMPNQHNWATVFYWEGPEGQYRFPDDIDAICRRLGRAAKPLDQLDADLERENREALVKARREKLKIMLEHYLDLRERNEGVRQTFGPGYIRRRQVKLSDLENTNHKRWMRAEGLL